MLFDPSYRAVTRQIAEEIVAMRGVDHAVRQVEQLAAQRRPIPTPR